ncbi:hypothetical protein [Streptomyces sp. NPDC002559]
MNELEKAQKAAEAANAKLAEAQDAEAERVAQIAAKRREREREFSKGFLSNWRERRDDAGQFERYPVADYDRQTMGFLEGIISWVEAREKRRYVLDAAMRAEAVLDIPSNQSTIPESRYYSPDIVAHINEIIQAEASRRAAEFADNLEAEREKFVNDV